MSRVKEYPTDADKWAAVTARSPAAQNAFVYCVVTTKIYCRPTCKVRLARRANVVFRDTAKEAQEAGFRACKRCRPDQTFYVEPEVRTISEVCETLRKLPVDAPLPSLDDLAAQASLTKFHFHRLFKRVTGKTPKEFAEECRRDKRRSESLSMASSEGPAQADVPSIELSMSGFPTPEELAQHKLSDASADNFAFDFWNLSPTPELSRSDRSTPWSDSTNESSIFSNPMITYMFEETTFGLLLVAFNEAGNVCLLELGESQEELLASLNKKRPAEQFLALEIPDYIPKPNISALLEAIEQPSGKVLNLDHNVIT